MLLPEKSVRPVVVYEFGESLLEDPDGTFLYCTTVGLLYIQRRILSGNLESIGWVHAGILSKHLQCIWIRGLVVLSRTCSFLVFN